MSKLEAVTAIVIAFIGSGAFMAVINFLIDKFKRKSNNKDIEQIVQEAINASLEKNQKTNNQSFQLLYQVKLSELTRQYIAAGQITVQQKIDLHMLWNHYHNVLGGNGYFDEAMKYIDTLPVITDNYEEQSLMRKGGMRG